MAGAWNWLLPHSMPTLSMELDNDGADKGAKVNEHGGDRRWGTVCVCGGDRCSLMASALSKRRGIYYS